MSWMEHPSICPYCGQRNDDAAHASGVRPQDGDATMCWTCRCLGIFEASVPGGVRKPTPQEMAKLMADPDVQKVLAAAAVSQTPLEASRRAGLADRSKP